MQALSISFSSLGLLSPSGEGWCVRVEGTGHFYKGMDFCCMDRQAYGQKGEGALSEIQQWHCCFVTLHPLTIWKHHTSFWKSALPNPCGLVAAVS